MRKYVAFVVLAVVLFPGCSDRTERRINRGDDVEAAVDDLRDEPKADLDPLGKADLDSLRRKLEADLDDLRDELGQLEADFKIIHLGSLRDELKLDLDSLRDEMKAALKDLRDELEAK